MTNIGQRETKTSLIQLTEEDCTQGQTSTVGNVNYGVVFPKKKLQNCLHNGSLN